MRYDFAIIGAGVVGLSTAYHLLSAEPSASVLLLEAQPATCGGNSAKSAALYRNLFGSATSRALASSSISYYESIAQEIALRPVGYLWAFSQEAFEESKEAIVSVAASCGGARMIERESVGGTWALASEPAGFPTAAGALSGDRCGALSAQALAKHYERLYRSAGGKLLTATPIARLVVSGSRVRGVASASGERYEADKVIATLGAWTQDIVGPAGFASHVYSKKRQLFSVRVPDPRLVLRDPGHVLRPPALILPWGGVYLKPVLERGLLVTGRADDVGRPFEERYAEVAKASAEESWFREGIEPALKAYFPALARAFPKGLELASSWAGHYDYHWPDRNPVVEEEAGLVWVAGSSGSGIMKADAIGRICAARALDREHAILFDGARFEVSSLSLRSRRVDRETLVI